MNKICLIIGIFILLKPTYSYAYLDPGTGSIILQAIIGFIAAGVTAISIYWAKFKSLFAKIFGRNKKPEDTGKSESNE